MFRQWSARAAKRDRLLLLVVGLGIVAGCSENSSTAPRAAVQATSSAAQAPLPTDDQLRAMVDDVLDVNYGRYLDTEKHAAWQIMHGVVGYGRALKISHQGELVYAVDWLLDGGRIRGWDFEPTEHGLNAPLGTGGERAGQGHPDQWLAILAQKGVGIDDPIIVRGKEYKIRDLVNQAQWNIYDNMEASWTVVGLSAYLPLDTRWTSKDGSEWTFERIVGMEARQNINESACGGTHRLGFLSMVVNQYLNEGGELTGGWAEAQRVIDEHVAKARQFQQPDGSFSASYFQRASNSPDVAVRIGTTGHTLEFLCIAMTDDQLKEDWVTRATVTLCNLLDRTRDMEVECGALYHALNGLQLYRYRRFGQRQYDPAIEPDKPQAAGAGADLTETGLVVETASQP